MGRTGNDLYPLNLGTTEIYDVGANGRQRTTFQPKHLVYSMMLHGAIDILADDISAIALNVLT